MVHRSVTPKRLWLSALVVLTLSMTAQRSQAYSYTALSGTFSYENEDYSKLVDGDMQTKWGQFFVSGSTESYVIFKSDRAIIPTNYCLIIANDTQTFPGRNWQSWNIYAANFATDEEAVRGASEWVLVDKKENEVVPVEKFKAVDYTCSEGITDAYTYFMVEVTAAVQSTEIYMQMSEFSWGTSNEFFNNGPIGYFVIGGDRNNGDGEGLPKMFDGNYSTKWGNTLNEGTPLHAIFKTTRPVAPTYYCLVTGGDNERWNHRNWRDWKIYGMNAASDAAVTRDSEDWVLIDERDNVTEDELPDYNSYEVFFTPNQQNPEAYTYFKIEISAIMSGSGFMQMSEFYLGDGGSLAADAQKHCDQVSADLTQPMQQSLAADYAAKLQAILDVPDIYTIDRLTKECRQMLESVKASIAAYSNYVDIVAQLRNHYENHDCITGEGRTIVGNYLDTDAGPSDTYPNGTFAYVLHHGLLDVDGIDAEGVFVNMMMERYASDLTDGAIDVTYEPFDGVAGFGNENFTNLIDGDDRTKWCSGNGDYWITFRTSEPIMPTYYRLVTGNDTGNNPGRNWKSWKIYGANFDHETDCVRESDRWVLIDEKTNVTAEQLPAANYAEAYLYMSNPPATPFEYFKIEISDPTGLMQMGEFAFMNGANFVLTRQEYYDRFASEDVEDLIACRTYVDAYMKTLGKLQTTASISELSALTATLDALLADIKTSENHYIEFDVAADEVRYAISYMSSGAADFWDAYFNDDIEPNNDYPYGSYSYIMSHLQIENAPLVDYISYLYDVARAALEGGFAVIAGNMDTWGEKENYFKLVDRDHATKWGGQVQNGGSWVIFSTNEPVQPLFYKLVTGNDTQGNPGRNWRDWQVYGGNFDRDADATVDADGWVLLDNRVGIGQDRLPAENFYTVPFGFSEGVDDEYRYFKVLITAAYSGVSIQMSEFEFGTEEELEELRDSYMAEIENIDIEGIVATDSLIDAYNDAESDIYTADDFEQIYLDYQTILSTYDRILLSAKVYDQYRQRVEDMKGALPSFAESDELATLTSYLTGEVAPGDLFPCGSAPVVLGRHVLDNDEVLAEIRFLNNLAKAALLKGYAAGADITAMVTNPSFADGAEGWHGQVYASNHNADYTMSAAEFCNAQSVFHVWQTLEGLQNGYYLVGINGGFRPANDIYGHNYAPMLYANDHVTYIQAAIDDMIPYDEAVDHENCWLTGEHPDKPILSDGGQGTDTLGYVIWGVQGSCQAFLAGRYQNYVVAHVTDGTLTFGVRNDGTQQGGDWTGLGNTTIKYLGDIDTPATKTSLILAVSLDNKLAKALTDYEGFYDVADYKLRPYVNEAALTTLRNNWNSISNALLSTPAEQLYAIHESNSDCFKQIYAAKNAYVISIEAMQTVRGKWDSRTELMTDAEFQPYDKALADIYEGSMGLFTADEALRAAADLKAAYPCYVDLDPVKSIGSLQVTETAPFEYELNADGNRPNIGLNNCMYEPLADDQCILAFDYKCDVDLEGGVLYFAHPALSTDEVVAYGTLPASIEWKRAYIAIRNDYGWGTSADHWMRWDLAASGTFDIYVRRMLIITKAQMEAEGGETINDAVTPPMLTGSEASDDRIYNIMGQRLTAPAKGINIIGGKKVMIK